LALVAERAGAAGITVHLREDRRHIQEFDVMALRRQLTVPLNLEMAVTPAMQAFALRLRPQEACLVPENRQEVTTEGGLDLLGQEKRIQQCVATLGQKGISVSLFIDPDLEQIRAAARIGAPYVELHTGAYAEARTKKAQRHELHRHSEAARLGQELGLTINAGHGLNYENVLPYLHAVRKIHTLNIGHSLVSYALEVGFAAAVKKMADLIRKL
jgi:pyridoxine 5-phosphate synthase